MPNASVRAAATGLPSSMSVEPDAIAARQAKNADTFLELEGRILATHGAALCLEHLFEDAVYGGRKVAQAMLKSSPINGAGYHITAMTTDQVDALAYLVDQISTATRALNGAYRSSPAAEGDA